MSDPFIGEIRMFGFNFAPVGWAQCNGQTLSISQNTALFSLLGTTYGGNGMTTFALPNLQSRVPIHVGTGLGLSPYVMGQTGGTENTTLQTAQMPQHTHTVALSCSTTPNPTGTSPSVSIPAAVHAGQFGIYGPVSSANATLGGVTVGTAGGSQPFNNIQPYLVVNFCIAMTGIFPSRN